MSLDDQETFADLQVAVQRFVAQQGWKQYLTPKDLGMRIAIEAAEIMELFQWLSAEQSNDLVQDPVTRANVITELVEILVNCLSLADIMDIDLCKALQCRLEHDQLVATNGY